MSVQDHLRRGAPTSSVGAARPSSFTASWPSVAAWGAGLVQTGLGAGAMVAEASNLATRSVGVGLVTLGMAALAWGAVSLSRSRLPAPRAAVGVAMAGVLAMFGLLALDPARTSVAAVAVATLLLVFVAATCAAEPRRRDAVRESGGLRGILGLLTAATVITVLVTPALGATQDAHLLRGDGTVPVVTHEGH